MHQILTQLKSLLLFLSPFHCYPPLRPLRPLLPLLPLHPLHPLLGHLPLFPPPLLLPPLLLLPLPNPCAVLPALSFMVRPPLLLHSSPHMFAVPTTLSQSS